jgi:tRNA(adenine34) deaminase
MTSADSLSFPEGRSPFEFMKTAYNEAVEAEKNEEVPVGAVIVKGNEIIARAHNQIETLKDPTAHAEIIAITQAAATLDSKVLSGTDIYVTLEPCPMCAMAIILAKIDRIFYGTPDPRTGACGSIMDIARDQRLNHQVEVIPGIMQEECREILKSFFKKRR